MRPNSDATVGVTQSGNLVQRIDAAWWSERCGSTTRRGHIALPGGRHRMTPGWDIKRVTSDRTVEPWGLIC